jgi:hypothetical protein
MVGICTRNRLSCRVGIRKSDHSWLTVMREKGVIDSGGTENLSPSGVMEYHQNDRSLNVQLLLIPLVRSLYGFLKSERELWQHRLGGNFSASPVFADGRIYFQSEEGVTIVIAPSKEFRPLATNTLDGMTFASIAVSQGSLFIRTDAFLYRIGK